MARRWKLATALVAVLLAFSAPAGAGINPSDWEYFGKIEGDPTTVIGFDVDKVNGQRRVRNVVFYAPFACYNGDQFYQQGFFDGGFALNDEGRFSDKRQWSFDADNSGKGTFAGRVKDGIARGTIRLRATESDETTGEPCYTGKLRWRAVKN